MNDFKRAIDFANENKVCFLATVESDQPRVRALGFWFADESGFYFQTGAFKEFPRQLRTNPKTEVCFYRADKAGGVMLRVCGAVEFLDERKLKERVIAERPFLKQFGLTAESPALVIFRIAHGQAHFWTMENNSRPKELISF